MTFCCGETASFVPGTALYLAVKPLSDADYDIIIFDAVQPVPLSFVYPRAQTRFSCHTPAGDNFTCEGGFCPGATIVPPTTDTAVAFVAVTSIYNLNSSVSFVDRQFSVAIAAKATPVGAGGLAVHYFNYSLAFCQLSFLNLYRSDGQMVDSSITFQEVFPACVGWKYRDVADQLQGLAGFLQSASSSHDYLTYAAFTRMFTLSDAWYGCQALVDRKLIRSSTVERSSTTTRCLLDEDDPLRASDPCCSYLVRFSRSCLPRNATYKTNSYRPVIDTVANTCHESPGCLYLNLEDYALVQQRNDDSSQSCAAQIGKVIDSGSTNSEVFLSEGEGRTVGQSCLRNSDCRKAGSHCTAYSRCSVPCLGDSECISGHCLGGQCTVPVEKEAQYDLLTDYYADSLRTFDRQYLRGLWGLTDNTSAEAFHAALVSNTLADQCVGSFDSFPDPEVCFTSASCNWGLCQTDAGSCEQSCLGKPSDFCGFCSSTNPEACIEVSEQEGCYVRDFNLDLWGDCSGLEADFTNYIAQECSWSKSTVPDAATCLDHPRCPYTRKQIGPFGAEWSICDSYCWSPSASSREECEAACPDWQEAIAVTCVWTGTECHLMDAGVDDCTYLAERFSDVEHWEGRVWKHGAYQTEETCSGVCVSAPGQSQADCSTADSCSVRRSLSQAYTTAEECTIGSCTDSELIHPDPSVDGVCVYPFVLEPTNGDPSCLVGTAKGQMGCINYAITSAANCVNGSVAGAFWRRPASSPEECTNHGTGCLEDRYTHARATDSFRLGAPGDYFLSSKSPTECAGSNGRMVPFYTWATGEWGNQSPSWREFVWRPREWKVLNTDVQPLLSNSKVLELLTLANQDFLAQSRQTYQYCRYNRVIGLLEKSSCSCTEPNGTCAAQEDILVGVGRACSYSPFSLLAYPTAQVMWSNVQFDPGCVDVKAYAVSAAALKVAKKEHFFSDMYARTIEVEAEGYSIIKNNHGVVVAQLIGDGVVLTLENQQGGDTVDGSFLSGTHSLLIIYRADVSLSGEITLCLYERSDILKDSAFPTYDLAYKQGNGALTILDIGAWTVPGDRLGVCANISITSLQLPTYFPVMRVNDWRDTRYIDRVSVESVIMFYVAVGVYACLLVVNTFNLINTGITLRHELKPQVTSSSWKKIKVSQVLHLVIEIILIDRIIYFSLLPTGELQNSPSIGYIVLGELPTYLFLTSYMLLVYFWCTLLYQINRAEQHTMRTIKVTFVVANVLVYSLLLLLILVFIALEETSSAAESSCAASDFLDPQESDQIRHIADLPEHRRSGSFCHRFWCQRLWYQGDAGISKS